MNYISDSKRLINPSGLSLNRYRYLNLEQTEPNLGSPSEKSTPTGVEYYSLSTINNPLNYDRYWIQDQQIPQSVSGISIFKDGFIVGNANDITGIDIRGVIVNITVSGTIATLDLSFPPSITNSNQSILFIDNDDFSVSSNLLFNSSGTLTVNNNLFVGEFGLFNVNNGYVGINSQNPDRNLVVNGDLKINGTIYDRLNFPGSPERALTRSSNGIRWLSPNVTLVASGIPRNVQYKNINNLIGGASELNYDEINSYVGIGTISPASKLHIVGDYKNNGITEISNNVGIDSASINQISISGQIIDINGNTGQQSQLLSKDIDGLIWKSFTFNDLSGNWGNVSTSRTDNTTYTNNTNSILFVKTSLGFVLEPDLSGTSGVTGVGWQLYVGSYSIAKVSDNLNNLIEVSRFRDNGNQNAYFIYLNNTFFVPSGSDYRVDVYNNLGTQFISSVTVFSWSEFELS